MNIAHPLLRHAALALLLAVFASSPTRADKDDTVALVGAFNTSGYDLFKHLVAARGNVAFSPYSIGAAMAMISSGASGDTASELASILHLRLNHDRMDAADSDILGLLNRYHEAKTSPECPSGMNEKQRESAKRCNLSRTSRSLRIANALILTKDDVVTSAYVWRLKEDYAAEVFRDVGLRQINGWVRRVTEGRIDHVLDRLPDKGIVLIDAVHFEQPWQRPFVAAATVDDDFHVSPTITIKVAMMHQRDHFPLVSGPGFRAIRLSYLTDALSMVVVLPDSMDGATALAQRLDAGKLADLFVALQSGDVYVDLSLPRFSASFSTELKSEYQQLGLLRPFDEKVANFSGITGRPKAEVKLWIKNIQHRTALKVAENGTEAAAATATSLVEITSAERRQPPPAEPFLVDRPFLFYITDDNTGLILFVGRISDPSKTD